MASDGETSAATGASPSRSWRAALPSVASIIGGFAMLVAGLGHLQVVLNPVNNGHHIDHGARYVAFFLVVGAVQLVLGKHLMTKPTTKLTLASIGVALGLITAYIYVVVAGLSVSATREPERVTTTGIVVMAAELVATISLILTLEGKARSWALNICLLIGGALWLSKFTGLLG